MVSWPNILNMLLAIELSNISESCFLCVLNTVLYLILELFILDVSSYHEFSDLKFGFVAGRGANMATSLANGVIT